MGPSMHIRLLGEFSFVLDGREIDQINTIRPQGLIAYLLFRATQSRQCIAFRLWPDSSEKHARTNLRQLYHRLSLSPEMASGAGQTRQLPIARSIEARG